jgi:hypothetical protein
MRKAYIQRAGLSGRRIAVWTPFSASLGAVVFLALLLSTTDGPAVPREFTHPDSCLACAMSTPEARAIVDATLIASGAMEDPADVDGHSGGSRSIARAALAGPRGQEEQRPDYSGAARGGRPRRASAPAREQTAAEQRKREK